MSVKRYRIPLILILALIIFFIAMIISIYITGDTAETPPFFNFIPGITGPQQTIIINMLYFVTGSLGSLFGGFIFAPLFLLIHKKIFGNKYQYGIEERPESEKFTDTSRSLIPALMTISLSQILGPYLAYVFLTSDTIAGGFEITATVLTISILSLLLIGISIAIFQGVWFIRDSGLVYSNKKEVEGTKEPVEIKSVGGSFKSFLEGYAGIGTLITFIVIVYDLTLYNLAGSDPGGTIIAMMYFLPLPFYLGISSLPGFILLDMIRERKKNY